MVIIDLTVQKNNTVSAQCFHTKVCIIARLVGHLGCHDDSHIQRDEAL